MAPWHVSSYFWPFFEPCLSIFSVQNRFSHIFPAPGGSPLLTGNLTVKLARLPFHPFPPLHLCFSHPSHIQRFHILLLYPSSAVVILDQIKHFPRDILCFPFLIAGKTCFSSDLKCSSVKRKRIVKVATSKPQRSVEGGQHGLETRIVLFVLMSLSL